MGEGSQTLTLSAPAKAWRVVALLACAVMFMAGTLIGDDHWWPFSPWRMFATSTAPSGHVTSTVIEVRTAEQPQEWVPASLNPWTVGINRAELEGRLRQVEADPAMLATLARAHSELKPDDPEWIGVRVVFVRSHLDAGALTGEVTRRVFATWEAR